MKKQAITIILFLVILLIGQTSYAAIEIVPSKNGAGTDAIVNTSVTNSYLLCQGMTGTGESLYGASVVPHLATNADWGAVSYLSNSIYGTNTTGQNTGIQITMNDVNYYSTTGNITGVMNWGANPNKTLYTQTSALIKAYIDDNSTSTANTDVKALYDNANTRFVETLVSNTVPNTRGMAMTETSSFYRTDWAGFGSSKDYPISVRKALFGFHVGVGNNAGTTTGAASAYATFRPIIWNR